jgi:hypothetical protein
MAKRKGAVMAVTVDTHVERINLAAETNVKKAIEELCDQQAARKQGRRLAATFILENQLVLIFQVAADNSTA